MARPGENCRSGCATRDHTSWGQCARAAALAVMDGARHKSWDGELQAYRDARDQGIRPAGTTMPKIRKALDLSDQRGAAYDAGNPLKGLTA